MNTTQTRIEWDFLRENPVEKTIDVDLEALVAPLRSIGRGLGEDGRPALVEYVGEIDLFEDKVPADAILQALAVMIACPLARFMVATVQPRGAAAVLGYLRPHLAAIQLHVETFGALVGLPGCFTIRPDLKTIPNLGVGVSVSDQASANDRVGPLLSIPSAFHFAQHAPATGAIDWTDLDPDLGAHTALGYRLDALAGVIKFRDGRKALDANGSLDWIFASGEGRGFRNTVHPDWIRKTARQCDAAGVPFALGAWGRLVPAYETKIDRPPELDEANRSDNLGASWSRSVAGGDVAGPVEVNGLDEEAIRDLREYHEKRRGRLVEAIGPDRKPATLAVPADDADAAWIMVPVDQAEAAGASTVGVLDGDVRFDLPAFLTGDEGAI